MVDSEFKDIVSATNTSRVISVAMDYLIMGKSTKETEIRINFHADNYEDTKLRIENAMRGAAYANAINEGTIALPPYVRVDKTHIRVDGDE